MQRQADVLGMPVRVAAHAEATALGAAAMAGVGAGLVTLEEVASLAESGEEVGARPGVGRLARRRAGVWRRFVEAAAAGFA